ncbi:MAG: hypothetical protein FWD09_08440, partial [Lentimicrobiaceae bacterium]|nr:hypothetical protein [Lentimicrobiaceae bacterium]
MKKNLLSFILCFLAICLFGTLNAQEPIYQLSNGNFENGWYRETSNAGSIVPVGFNSFYSGAGSLIGTASAQRQDSSRDVRAGATGAFSLRMYSTTVLGIRANGNVTTGRIYASSMTANNAGNYNYTDYAPSSTTTPPNPSKFCPEITGTPDSLRFWVKYLPGRTGATNTTDRGRIRVYIHGIGECRDAPQYPSGMTEVQLYYGKAMKEFYKEDGGWHCYQVPFEYTGNNDQRNDNGNFHVLVSMTTNATPGGGANNADQVWFDDIEFVYSAWLSDLQVNGETFEDFEQSTLEYFIELTGQAPYEFPYQPEDFTCIKESNWAQVADPVNIPGPTGDADKGYTSIVVTANDGSTKEYKIRYASNPSSDNTITGLSYTLDGENAIAVSGVNPATLSYTTTLQDPDETRIPQVREEDVILSDPYATITFINQPKSVNNSVAAITVRAEDFSTKIYTLNFSKPISSNSKLAMIRVAGVPVADFHADTLVYEHHIDMCATSNAMLAVTAVASSVWANISYTQATLTNRTATILVMAEDSTQTTYTINFILTNDNTTLLGYRVGSTNRNNSFNAGNDYTDVYSTNFTAVPALSLSTTSGQQGCAGQQVIFQPAIFFPDTNFIKVTAQNGVDTQMYRSVLKSTNCYVATGANNGFRYNYGGLTDQNTGINITTANNNNTNTITTTVVTLPIGPPTPPELVVRAFTTTVALPTAHIVQPTHRNDTAIVTVVANDGTTQKIYRIPFRATLSPDATLSNITYDGFQVPGFNPTRELYTLIFPSNVTEVPDIEFTPSFQWLPEENIVFTPAASLSDTATIEVTAENGTTKRTYRIVFEVVEQEKDAYLTDIRYNNVTISGFNPTTFNYTIDIPYSAPTPPAIAAYASSPTALVFYATQLNTPPYTQRILVFSEDMTVNKIYTVDFNLVKNTNAALEDIQINGVSLQDFNSEVFAYDYELHYTELDAPVVSATPAFEHAQVVVNQINTTTGTVAIHVTAEDETYTEVYTVHFTRELSPVTAIEAIEYEYNEQIYMHDVTVSGTEIIIMLPVETEGEPMIDHVVLADHRADFV